MIISILALNSPYKCEVIIWIYVSHHPSGLNKGIFKPFDATLSSEICLIIYFQLENEIIVYPSNWVNDVKSTWSISTNIL